jgi:hypothetical protein
MKKVIRILVVTAFLLAGPIFLMAQPHPNNGGAAPNTLTNTPVGGMAAPIGSGFIITLVLSAGYGARKVFDLRKNTQLEE